jgi:hypothetical protein
MAASRTFDVTMMLKQGMGEYQFSNINREEQSGLESFFKSKGLKVKNEIEEVCFASRLRHRLTEAGECAAGQGAAGQRR